MRVKKQMGGGPTPMPTKHSRKNPTSPEEDRLRWRRQKAAQRDRRKTGGFYVATTVPREQVDLLKQFVKIDPGEQLTDPETAADVTLAAIALGARYRQRMLELEARIAELERGQRK